MADKKIKVSVDVDSNLEPTIANLKELKRQLKQTAAGSDEFKKIFNQIDDLEDKIKSAKGASSDWIDTLESAGGPIGMLGSALNKAKVATISFGSALKAAGIGLIVSAVAGLVAAFSNVEGATKKLEPLLIGFEKILGGIFEALTPLIDGFIELATQALPYITTGIKVFYSSLVALFTLVKEAGVGVGKILKGVFTLDMDSIKEGWEQLKGGWSKTVESYNATSERFEAGTKKLTKTQKENLKQQNDDAKKAFDEKLKILEAEDKLDEARIKKLKEEALALATTEQEKLDVEKKFAKLSYDAKLKDLDDKMALYKKDSVEYKNLQTEKITAEADYISQTTDLADKQKKLTEDAAEKQKKINEDNIKAREDFALKIKEILTASIEDDIARQKQERQNKLDKDLADLEKDKEFIKLSETEKSILRVSLLKDAENDITNIELTAEQQRLDKKLRLLELNGQALLQGTRSYYENRKSIIDELENKELLDLKAQFDRKKISVDEFEKATTDIQAKYAQQRKDVNKQELNDYLGYATNILGAINGIFSSASEVAKMQQEQDLKNAKGNAVEEEKIRKNAFEQNKKTQIAQAIIGTLQAAIQAYQSLAVIPVVGPALGAAAAAAALVFGYKKVALIKSQTYESQAAGGTATATGGAPNINVPQVAGATAPQIQTGQGINPSAQIGETIAGAQKPIRAYVVSGEVSSQQALDRRTSRAATFTGG
jgi:hypothetical protein